MSIQIICPFLIRLLIFFPSIRLCEFLVYFYINLMRYMYMTCTYTLPFNRSIFIFMMAWFASKTCWCDQVNHSFILSFILLICF